MPIRVRRCLGALVATLAAWPLVLPEAGLSSTPVAGAPASSAAAPQTIHISPTAAQTMSGFGASGAWWPIDLAGFPARTQAKIADLLFSRRTGIGLSSYRYNIGGGGVGVTNRRRAPASFFVRPGVYDFSRDRGGMRFLQLANARGVPSLTGFVNSAPPAWTSNGMSCGGQLRPGSEAAYARYLADVVRHLHDAERIRLSYVSPMNEPDNTFANCGQEGMSVPVAQRAAVVRALGSRLAAVAPYARVIADESSLATFQFLPEVPTWLATPNTARWVAALAHHTYEFPTDAMAAQVATLGPRFHKPLWMTEICCYNGRGSIVGFGPQYDPTMVSGVALADDIWQDLSIIHDASFDWWTALSSQLGCDPLAHRDCPQGVNTSGWNDGLLYYDQNFQRDGNFAIYTPKRYWVMGNFSRYVRPGAVQHDLTGVPAGLRALAFSQAGRWTVIVINDGAPGTAAVGLRIALPGVAGLVRAIAAVRTSATSNLARVGVPGSSGRRAFLARVPGQSVTTYVFAPVRR